MSDTMAATMHPDHISPIYVTFIAVASVLTALSTICCILRYVQRWSTETKWDDWLILGALFFAFAFLATTVLVGTLAYAGYHINEYTGSELNTYMKIALANNIVYNASITLSKASVLYFYYRIFGIDRSLRYQLWAVSFLLVGYFLSALFGLIFAYNPVSAQWNVLMPHTTIQTKAFWCSMAVINMLLDVIILAIPQRRVWKLHLSRKRRVLISGVFLLGAFVIVASAIRISYMLTVDVNDLTYTFSIPGIWTNVELNLSIICADLPIVYSLFKSIKDKKAQSSKMGSSNGYQYQDLELTRATKSSLLRHVHIRTDNSRGQHSEMGEYGNEPFRGPHVQREFYITDEHLQSV